MTIKRKLISNLNPLIYRYYQWRYWNNILNKMEVIQGEDTSRLSNQRKPGIVLSFDDSFRVEHWHKYAKELFGFYNIKATFNINAFHHFMNQREHSQKEIDMLLDLQADGHEIAHHGFKHERAIDYTNKFGLESWIEDEITALFNWMSNQSHSLTGDKFKNPVTYAFPHFNFDEQHINKLVPKFFKVVRGHYGNNNLTQFNQTGFIPSICIDSNLLKNRKYIMKILRKAKKLDRNIILTCHSILPEEYNWDNLNFGIESKNAGKWRISPDTINMIISEATKLDMPFYTTAEIAGIATFIDDNLEQVIRNQLSKPTLKWIPIEELYLIKSLDISNQNITGLDGIEYFENLETLNISNNPIKDFRLLKKLPKLKKVITNKTVIINN